MAVYSFLDVQAAITGPGGAFSLSSGGVSGEGITTAMVADKNTMTAGADGSIMHSLHASNAGRVTVRCLKTGTVNALLSKMFNYQTSASAYHGQNVITIRNPQTGDNTTASQAAFTKKPDNTNAAEGGMIEWVFDCGVVVELLGSGTPVAF